MVLGGKGAGLRLLRQIEAPHEALDSVILGSASWLVSQTSHSFMTLSLHMDKAKEG